MKERAKAYYLANRERVLKKSRVKYAKGRKQSGTV